MHMDAPFCDVVLVVRTWMRFMMCDMFVCMIRHVDAPMDTNVVLWFMYMDANVDAMQSFWVFIYLDEMLWDNDA